MEDTIGVREAWTSFTHKFFGKSSQSEETVSSSTTTDAPAKSATETFFSKEVEEKIQALIKQSTLQWQSELCQSEDHSRKAGGQVATL